VQAQAILVPTLNASQTVHIYECKTASEIMKKLKDINSDASEINKQQTLMAFFNYKVGPEQNLIDAYTEMQGLWHSLKEIGVPMEESAVVTKIISSLPDSKYSAFKKAWDSVAEASQTMTVLLARFKKEELDQKGSEGQSTKKEKSKAFFTSDHKKGGKGSPAGKSQNPSSDRKKGKCHFCGKEGHWKMECRSRKEAQAKKGDDPSSSKSPEKRGKDTAPDPPGNKWPDPDRPGPSKKWVKEGEREPKSPAQAFMCRDNPDSQKLEWYSDSGASQHICGSSEWFRVYHDFQIPKKVYLTDSSSVDAIGGGTVELLALIDGVWTYKIMEDVLYIPKASNLFSELTMARRGYTIVRDNRSTRYIGPGDSPGPIGTVKDNLFVMKFKPTEAQINALSARVEKSHLWHQRMAHINCQYLLDTVKKNAVTGIDPAELRPIANCESCHVGKETRKPFPSAREKKKTIPGEMIHSDTSGKMPVKSLGGNQYFLIFIDEATGHRVVYFLARKSDAADAVIDYVHFMERQTGNKMKTFRTDNGTEFVNETLETFFSENGIVHETPPAYCPESNGKAERSMRTLKDTARSMMATHGTPEFLWAEAVACSVFIHNRTLNKWNQMKTPFEQIFQRKPFLGSLRVFGCKAYSQIPDQKRTVWTPKGQRMVFVGYDPICTRKFRLYDPSTCSIVTARNVSFDESIEKGVRIQIVEEVKEPEGGDTPEKSDDDDDEGGKRGFDRDEEPHHDEEPQEDEEFRRDDDSHDDEDPPLDDDSENGKPHYGDPKKTAAEKAVKLTISTPDGGRYEGTIPSQALVPYVLRDRGEIRKPAKYANLAKI